MFYLTIKKGDRMSYRCDNCGEVHYGKMLRHVSKKRAVNYNKHVSSNYKIVFEEAFNGWEIAKEDKLCSKCYENRKEAKFVNTKSLDFVGLRRHIKLQESEEA